MTNDFARAGYEIGFRIGESHRDLKNDYKAFLSACRISVRRDPAYRSIQQWLNAASAEHTVFNQSIGRGFSAARTRKPSQSCRSARA